MILIISTCKEKLSELEFARPIEKLTNGKIVHYTKLTKQDIDKADKIIITGTALKDFDYLDGDFKWIKNYNKPILGICAGAQLMTDLTEDTQIGVQKVTVIKENKLCEGEFNAYFLHTKGIKGMEVLAQTNGKPCLAKHPTKEQYACIFHPEVMNEDIIKKFIQDTSEHI